MQVKLFSQFFSCLVHILRMLIEYPQLALGRMWATIIFWEAKAQLAQISNHNRFSGVGLLLISASGCVLQ
jgi:hypothetical protein